MLNAYDMSVPALMFYVLYVTLQVGFKAELEVALPEEVYWWHDKYRPRKPRFFNRVRTGFDWNKYNQTHYDKENPPPKIVQGYKFNIFYPDLIDASKVPTRKHK